MYFLGCRTVPNLDDVALAFDQLGIQMDELEDYVQQVESSPATHNPPEAPVQYKKMLLEFAEDCHLPPIVDIKPVVVQIKSEPIEEEEHEGVMFHCILVWYALLFILTWKLNKPLSLICFNLVY